MIEGTCMMRCCLWGQRHKGSHNRYVTRAGLADPPTAAVPQRICPTYPLVSKTRSASTHGADFYTCNLTEEFCFQALLIHVSSGSVLTYWVVQLPHISSVRTLNLIFILCVEILWGWCVNIMWPVQILWIARGISLLGPNCIAFNESVC